MVSKLYESPIALGDLEARLIERNRDFRDELVPVSALRFAESGRLALGRETYRLQGQALDQIAGRLRVPANYLRRCPAELRATNLNHWLNEVSGDVLVRFDKHEVRAMLSDRYQPVSHLELVQSLLTTCPSSSPVRYELNSTSFFLQVLRPAEERSLLGGVSAQNSETGHLVVELNALIYRVICTNGLILSGGEVNVRRRHTRDAGATVEELKQIIAQAWPNAARHADRFEAMRMIRATPTEPVMNRIDQEYRLNERQVAAVRLAASVEPGYTLFDVINAYTRAGNDASLCLEERTQLQSVGGRVLAMAEQGHRWI
jgi:hypothetical protein